MSCPRLLDPVDIAVAWDRLVSIADEGAATLIRTSFSTLVREGFDLSIMIFDDAGRMIAQSTKCIPVFIGTAPVTMAHMLAKYPPRSLREGDVVVSNDPTIGTGHMFDIAIMRPVFRDGFVVGYAMSITHLPTSAGWDSRPPRLRSTTRACGCRSGRCSKTASLTRSSSSSFG